MIEVADSLTPAADPTRYVDYIKTEACLYDIRPDRAALGRRASWAKRLALPDDWDMQYRGRLLSDQIVAKDASGNVMERIISKTNANQGSWNAPTRGALTVYTDNSESQHSAIVGLNPSGQRRYGIDFLDSPSPSMRLYAGNAYVELNHGTGELLAGGSIRAYSSVYAGGGYLVSSNYVQAITIGSGNADYCHFQTTAPRHYFNKPCFIAGEIYAGPSYSQRVYHTGNLTHGTWYPSGASPNDIYIRHT